MHIITYFLIIGRTKAEVIQGFTKNWEKSILNPTKEKEILGMMINSVSMEVLLPEEKAGKLLKICKNSLSTGTLTVGGACKVWALQQDFIMAQQK